MQFLKVLGPIAVAIVAVLAALGWFERFKRPKLELISEPNIKRGIRFRLPEKWIFADDGSFIRIGIINTTKHIAKNVIVKVIQIERCDGKIDNEIKKIDPYRPEIVGYFEKMDVYPFDRSNMFDLVQTTDESDYKKFILLCFSSVAERGPRANPQRIPREDYLFTVALYGDNIDPVVKKIRVLAKDKKAGEITAEIV
jgi:hypothetical protein